uniref:NADH dehydrogenase subunit 1 n=1 Tax=Paraschizogynium plumachela TaxID=3109024 RepID=UPI002E780510|nr:NADH dehydrogenase subunit 1 [Paraschizogynium plumachela]WQM21762.1 NADH dehydrogenase subunit 1 [Paraschizogynium plumachela]
MIFMVNYFILMVCVLVSVAFVTLLERKILGYIQVRKGPNKVGVMGIFQPFADAIKLFTKETNYLYYYNGLVYLVSPMLSLLMMLMIWLIYMWSGYEMMYSLVYVMAVSSMGVYVILFSGWSSNSKYAMLGSYRGVAQTISYEVGFSFIIMGVFMFLGVYTLSNIIILQDNMYMLMLVLPVFMLWLVSILAETNRTPFDFAEGESELVSGFNIEYGSGGFALLFMAEYGNIIFMSYLTSMMFMGGGGYLMMKMMIVVMFYLWIRGTLARFRYDNLMMLSWKVILPVSIFYIIILLYFKIFLVMI